VICRVGGTVHRGRTVSLAGGVAPDTVATAIREGAATDAGGVTVSVTARTPHPVHERVGCLAPALGLRVRTALAAAARARGLGSPHDGALRRARRRLAAITAETGDGDSRDGGDRSTADARERLADARDETDRLRERVATVRGRLRAREEGGLPTEGVRADLEAAARDLSEVETAAVAARQTLERARRQTRETRDALEERFRLQDRVANLERRARRALVERVRDVYAAAVADVPGSDEPTDPFAVDALTAGFAVARVADLDAPAVVTGDRFGSARAAGRWLGAPVVRV
jgi:hypothetical protein